MVPSSGSHLILRLAGAKTSECEAARYLKSAAAAQRARYLPARAAVGARQGRGVCVCVCALGVSRRAHFWSEATSSAGRSSS